MIKVTVPFGISLIFLFICYINGDKTIPSIDYLPEQVIRGLKEKTIETYPQKAVFKPCGTKHVPYLPGTTRMQFGYNFVRDSITMHGSHLEILDTYTTTSHNITVEYNGICYKIPDAFVSNTNYGIDFRSYTSTRFHSTGAKTAAENRFLDSKKRELEIGLDVEAYENGINASFTNSHEVKEERENTRGTTHDASESIYLHYIYGLQVKQPIPSRRIVHVWKKLYEEAKISNNSYLPFRKYFDTHGTHYFAAGMIGGELKIGYTLDRYHQTLMSSTANGRANCLGAKISRSYMGISAAISARACEDQYTENARNSSFLSLTKKSWSICEGGASYCPLGPGYDVVPENSLKRWRENLKSDLELIRGTKRWITFLLDFIINFSDYQGTKMYYERLKQFGSSDSEKENKIKLKEFRDMMHQHLLQYIQDHSYCKLYGSDPWCGNCLDKCTSGRALSFDPDTKKCICEQVPTEDPMTDESCYWKFSKFRCQPVDKCSFQLSMSKLCRLKNNV